MKDKLKHHLSHPWVKTVDQARRIQEELRSQVITTDSFETVNYVAGVDVGFKDNYKITKAAVAVLSYPDLNRIESAIAELPTTFPYIPGFLSFREIPALLEALDKLNTIPDLILCDGQGIAHPRRMGIAAHLGVILDLPTIGVAKSRLIGEHDELATEKGNWQPLRDRDEIIGAVLRSRTNVKPLYISPGHKISLPTALHYVMGCLTQYRLPETTRWSDSLASSRSS